MDCNKEIGFLGGVFKPGDEKEILRKSSGSIQIAANNFQWSFIRALADSTNSNICVFNRLFIGSFPLNYSDMYISYEDYIEGDNIICKNINFINVYGIRQLILNNLIKLKVRKWVKKDSSKLLFIYSSNFSNITSYVKKINKKVHICLILPDLPNHTYLDKSENIFYKTLKNRKHSQLLRSLRNVDSYVLFSEFMKSDLGIEKSNYTILEGMVSKDNTLNKVELYEEVKTICYTGTLTKKYGVLELVYAFQLIKDIDCRLIICGDGEARKEIEDLSKSDRRIIYKGMLPVEEIRIIQQSATILINPRNNKGEFTKYSFPSKNLEYMLAGRPVLCYKLDGIPDEYDDYYYYFDNDSVNSIKSKIEEVLLKSNDELDELGRRSREFVLENKTSISQVNKVLDMISSMTKEEY